MRSRLLLNIVLFLIAIALTVFLISTGKDDTVKPDVVLTTIDPATVTGIRIIRSGQDEIVFNKQKNLWIMQDPYQLLANQFRIETLMKLLTAHSYTQFNAEEVDLEGFLLKTPAVSIQFDNARVDFGDTSPLGKQRYVLFDNTVHLINDSLYQQLQTPATFFISPKLLPPDADITALDLPEHHLRKTGDKWALDPQGNISADKIVQVVSSWRTVEAITVREFEEKDVTGTIRIELKQGDPIEFVIVSKLPELVLARPEFGIQYHISSYDAEQLFFTNKQEAETEDGSSTTDDLSQPITNH